MSSTDPIHDVTDVTSFYRAWDDLFQFSLKMALATAHDTMGERQEAWERFLRGQERALADRDAMWERILRRLEEGQGGR